MSTLPDANSMPQKGWWSRNWLWVIPLGCVLPLLLCCGGAVSVGLFVFGMLKDSEVYKESVAQARNNPEVKQMLGEPIETGFWVAGSVQVNGTGGGHAEMMIPLNGPKGSAIVSAVAEKANDKWRFTDLEVHAVGSEKVLDLLAKPGDREKSSKSKALP